MAKGEFLKALPRILVYEGGKVDDPRDPGGRTNQGVTQGTFNAYLRAKGQATRDVFTMQDAERNDIYKGMYWDRARGDDLPVGLGFAVFDAAVNSGVGQAVKWLQAALGSDYTGQVDGVIGEKSLQAVSDHGDIGDVIVEFCSRRLGTLKRLKTWSIYGKGWSARIANVQKIAVSWSDASDAPNPVDVTPDKGHKKAPVVDNLTQPPITQITAHVTTAATSAGAIASQTAQQVQPLAETFGWIKNVFGGLTLLAVVAGVLVKISADASKAAADGTAKSTVDPDADANLTVVKIVDAPADATPALGT